jgi:hypothetical protein
MPHQFSDVFPKTRVTVVRADGTAITDVPAIVAARGITLFQDLQIEIGDVVKTTDEDGRVLDRVITYLSRQTLPGAGDVIVGLKFKGCQADSLASTLPPTIMAVGANARVNFGSIDRSRNTYLVSNDSIFNDLREQISKLSLQNADVIEGLVDRMASSRGTGSFLEHYTDFMSFVADHIQVLQPLLPLLPPLAALLK